MNRYHARVAIPAIVMAGAIALLLLALGTWDANDASAQQAGQVELSLNATGLGVISCDPGPKPDKCSVVRGAPFTLVVSINTIPLSGYASYGMKVIHTGMISKDVRYDPATGFATFPISGVGTESFTVGAITSLSPPIPSTTYTGPLVEADLNCPAASTFKISIAVPPTNVRDTNNDAISITTVLQGASKVADTLLINCEVPVGGIAGPPELAGRPLEEAGKHLGPSGTLVTRIAVAATAAFALGGVAWYARRRRA